MNEYLDLFGTFAKVGVMTFGGGMAMLPILQREVGEDRHAEGHHAHLTATGPQRKN